MKKFFILMAVVLWMAFIFYLSHQPAVVSNELSKRITEYIVLIAEKVFPNRESSIGSLNNYVRDNAHFLLYLVLGLLVITVLGIIGLRGYWGMGLAFLLCALYAVSDEIHQTFTPGRGAQFKDVLTDSAGVVVGIIVYLIIYRGMFSKKEKNAKL